MTALMHWLWQGIVLVAVVSLCLSRARRVSASMRYRVWWVTLALVLALPVLGVLDLPGVGALLGVASIAGPADLSGATTSARIDDSSRWTMWLPLVAFVGWVLWNASRFYGALAHLDAAKRACRPFPVVRERALSRWKAARNRGRRATLVVSEHVRAAAVLGLGYPRIAITPELLASLTDDELDQLVLHEYAHVQRRDDQATAVQLLVNALVGWHPAVWWIDRRLRIEREVACDDWVLATTGVPRAYARCLTRIADVAVGSDSSLIPAATRQPQLTTRIVRLLDARRNTSIRPSTSALAAATMVLAVVSVGLAGSHTTVITLPAVARAGVARAVDTPELTFSTLFQALAEPTGRRAARPSRDDGTIAARVTNVEPVSADVVSVAAVVPRDGGPIAADAVAASMDYVSESKPTVRTEASSGSSAAAEPAFSTATDAEAAARSEEPADTSESDSWIDSTRRALADAGKTTGQSIAEASITTGFAVADAGVAAARGTQKSAVKAGRFLSRLGRTLARPF